MDALMAHVSAAPDVIPAIIVISFFASIVQFGLGMGFGLMAAPLLALLDPELVPAPVLFLGLLTATLGALREREGIVWREVRTGAFGRLVGGGVSVVLLSLIATPQTFALIFGLCIGLAVLMSFIGRRITFTRGRLLSMSVLSGTMATITSVGAPPLALIYQDRPPDIARPTLAAFFAVGCAISLGALYASGWATIRDFHMALLMVPGVIGGAIVARFTGSRFDRRYRLLLLGVAGVAAVMLIARGLS